MPEDKPKIHRKNIGKLPEKRQRSLLEDTERLAASEAAFLQLFSESEYLDLIIQQLRNEKKQSSTHPIMKRKAVPLKAVLKALQLSMETTYWIGYRNACYNGGKAPTPDDVSFIKSHTEHSVPQFLEVIHREVCKTGRPNNKPVPRIQKILDLFDADETEDSNEKKIARIAINTFKKNLKTDDFNEHKRSVRVALQRYGRVPKRKRNLKK